MYKQLGLVALLFPAVAHARGTDPFDPARMHAELSFLAAPLFEGRGTGTPGADRAAAWLAGEMERLGLVPAAPDGGYLQSFPVILGTRRGPGNHLRVGRPPRTVEVPSGAAPYPFSSNGTAVTSLVFAGYGISAPSLGYDDYAGLEVAGRTVLVLDGEPREKDRDSPFRAPEAFRFRELRYKATTARDKGAAALLVVARGAAPATTGEGPAGSRAGTMVLSLARPEGEKLLAEAGADLAALEAAIEAGGKPASRAFPLAIEVGVELAEVAGTGYNAVGRIPGTTATGECVVVGAHYDHLGLGGEGSLAPDARGHAHLGADDNASGTVGILALARDLMARPTRRDVVVAAFGGEEMGLLGSHALVKAWKPEHGTLAAMVNLDMVGRMKDGKIFVHGVDTARGLRELTAEALAGSGLTPSFSGDGYGPSDHTAFYAAGIPVLFFFTGPHVDYHRPSDSAEKIEPEPFARAVAGVGRALRTLADREGRLEVVKAVAPAPSHGSGGRSDGYGAYFGSIPDFSESPGGVLLSGVRAGSPAELGGVRAGDKIVRFGGKRVENLHDFTFALRSYRPGDEVELVVLRAGAEVPLKAVLGTRP